MAGFASQCLRFYLVERSLQIWTSRALPSDLSLLQNDMVVLLLHGLAHQWLWNCKGLWLAQSYQAVIRSGFKSKSRWLWKPLSWFEDFAVPPLQCKCVAKLCLLLTCESNLIQTFLTETTAISKQWTFRGGFPFNPLFMFLFLSILS